MPVLPVGTASIIMREGNESSKQFFVPRGRRYEDPAFVGMTLWFGISVRKIYVFCADNLCFNAICNLSCYSQFGVSLTPGPSPKGRGEVNSLRKALILLGFLPSHFFVFIRVLREYVLIDFRHCRIRVMRMHHFTACRPRMTASIF
jgi:hypothetical protein